MNSRRWIAVLSIATVSVVIIAFLSLSFLSANQVVDIFNANVTYQDPMTAGLEFKDIGEFYIQTSYINASYFRECWLQISFSLYTGSQYTKSIILKLSNAMSSDLSFGMNTYSEPPTKYRADYGYEPPSTKSLTIYMPYIAPGATWIYTVYVYNPPTVNGKLQLNLVIGVQVIENHFQGKIYNLQASIQIPAVS